MPGIAADSTNARSLKRTTGTPSVSAASSFSRSERRPWPKREPLTHPSSKVAATASANIAK